MTHFLPKPPLSLAKGSFLVSLLAVAIAGCSESTIALSPTDEAETVVAETISAVDTTNTTVSPKTAQAKAEELSTEELSTEGLSTEGLPKAELPEDRPNEPLVSMLEAAAAIEVDPTTPYGEVRSRLMQKGWIPHTFRTNGPVGNWLNPMVEAMGSLGFNEIKDCSGEGYCRFEFVYTDRTLENGAVLAVTTAPTASGSIAKGEEPLFSGLRLEDTADTTYAQQAFDAALFSQLQATDSFCLGVGQCNDAKYVFKDALLIGRSHDFGTTKISLIFAQPISREIAINYARMLDAEAVIDFSESWLDSDINSEVFSEAVLPGEAIADQQGSATTASLSLADDGQVSEVSFGITVF
ncbi:MAG: hypothetical protein AAFO06_09365 [Cyanobacteria bacterium J06597_16]